MARGVVTDQAAHVLLGELDHLRYLPDGKVHPRRALSCRWPEAEQSDVGHPALLVLRLDLLHVPPLI